MLCIVCLDSLMIILGHHYVTILLAKTLNWAPFSQSMCNFYFCINPRSILTFLMRDIYINFNLNPLATLEESYNLWDKIGTPFWAWWNVNGNWDNNMTRISQWRESHRRTNTSVRRKKEIQKSRSVGVTIRDPSRKVNHLNKVIWERKIITQRSKFALAVGKCWGFCRGISTFLSICLCKKNAEATEWWWCFSNKFQTCFHEADHLPYYPHISVFSFHTFVVLLYQFLRNWI